MVSASQGLDILLSRAASLVGLVCGSGLWIYQLLHDVHSQLRCSWSCAGFGSQTSPNRPANISQQCSSSLP